MTNGGMCGRERLRSDATRRGRRGYIAFGAEGGGGGPQLVAAVAWEDVRGLGTQCTRAALGAWRRTAPPPPLFFLALPRVDLARTPRAEGGAGTLRAGPRGDDVRRAVRSRG